MKKIIEKIRSVPYEKRIIAVSTVTTGINSVVALGKIAVGIFSDIVMCAVGVFNVFLIIAKISCIVGERKRRPFGKRNTFTAVFLFCAGLLYTGYMAASLFFGMPKREYMFWTPIMMAAIAFTEMGVAVYGLIKTKRRGHYYRNIKIISFVSALTAIMTAQIALLSFNSDGDNGFANGYAGIGLGIITMLLAVYVYFAPQISTIDREHNIFRLAEPQKNRLVDMNAQNTEITLRKSKIHGDCIFAAVSDGRILDGHIKKTSGFWKGLPLIEKILFIILSEILIFVWAISYAIYFFRTLDMPGKLGKTMKQNGFEPMPLADEDDGATSLSEDK